jgi:hypothetical protein
MQKARVVLHTRDSDTYRDLRLLLAEWCELQSIDDLKSLDHYCNEHGDPVAAIFENGKPAALHVGQGGGKDEVTDFLAGVRARHPAIRRVLIADPNDLHATINGLHARTIDSLLHKPLEIAGVLAALRLEKTQLPTARPGAFAAG